MKRTSRSKRKSAEEFFIENLQITQKQVAEIFGITENTISRWAKEDEWVAKRNQYHASPVKIRQLLQEELLRVAGGEEPTLNADGIRKLQLSIAQVQKAASPIVVNQILKELDNFISEQDPELAQRMLKYHKAFLRMKIENEEA